MVINVSIIVPAHDAADTLADTLESVLAQTHPEWEAIVVDDGSTDATSEIAHRFAARDARIRTIGQPQAGEAAARNAGLAQARSDWLLFLDSDDLLVPTALERFTGALADGSEVEGVYSRWARRRPDGRVVPETFWPTAENLFAVAARFCPFAIHACLVRRASVEAVGGFDTRLRLCADWDLWQRLARAGARFCSVDEVLAQYRMRPGSAVSDARALATFGLRMVTRGHSADSRVASPAPAFANGLAAAGLANARLSFVCWPAGMLMGAGQDARPLLGEIPDDRDPELEPSGVAHSLFKSALLPGCLAPEDWVDMWPRVEDRLDEFLQALEEQSGARDLARRVRRTLERLVGEKGGHRWPCSIGSWHFVRLEATRPLPAVTTRADWLHCAVEAEGEPLGTLELPVSDGLVSSDLLADGIVAHLAWPLLGRFFARTVYRLLDVRRDGGVLSVWRGDVCLARDLPEDPRALSARLHDAVGWTVFLQELWGRPAWSGSDFYDPARKSESAKARRVEGPIEVVEISDELGDLKARGDSADVELRVGGAPVAVVSVPVRHGRVRAQTLRVRLTSDIGYELCRAAVREGVIGVPFTLPLGLRERLAAASTRARDEAPTTITAPPEVALAPGWRRAVGRALGSARGVVLGRHLVGHPASSASRVAAFPVAALPALVEAAEATGEPILRTGGEVGERAVYAPDLLWKAAERPGSAPSPRPGPVPRTLPFGAGFDRHHFETTFHATRDPWRYLTPFEQRKYEQTLSLLPERSIGRALELACAEGVFTAQLAPRVRELVASDVSQIAVDRAAERCRGLGNVAFARIDFMQDSLPDGFDLVVCSEVLYYARDEAALTDIARKIAGALARGGHLLSTHCHVVADDPSSPGLDWDVPFGAKRIGEILASTGRLRFVRELRTALYRVQLFEREDPWRRLLPWGTSVRPGEIIEAPCLPPEPPLSDRFLMAGGQVRKGGLPRAVTWRLPILMYHQVAPSGAPAFARYRVTPDAFEEQLRYLKDAGFRGVTLDEWRDAQQRWEPLPGRAVLLTFDDGYRDFATHAWPLLARYGFSAIVFLVADRVGQTNAWDSAYGEVVPLMGWEEIRRLQAEGIEFGSHSTTHPFLTALDPAGVVREAARSRAILARGLGSPVPSFAYPHGAEDPAIQHIVGACGYVYGLSCRPGAAELRDPLLALPRLEVTGSDTLATFIGKLGA